MKRHNILKLKGNKTAYLEDVEYFAIATRIDQKWVFFKWIRECRTSANGKDFKTVSKEVIINPI